MFLVALAARATYAALVVRHLSEHEFRDVHGDTNGYVRLGENLFEGKPYAVRRISPDNEGFLARGRRYAVNVGKNRSRALARPPGYPAFYASMRAVGLRLDDHLSAIVWPQVFFSAVAASSACCIAAIATRSASATVAAGLLVAVSPTGIGAASLATPDSIYSGLFTISFALFASALFWAKRQAQRNLLMWLAGLLLALSISMKPAPIYWPLIACPAILLVRRQLIPTISEAALYCLPVALIVGAWTSYNLRVEGLPVYSTIAIRNLRYDVVPRIQFAAREGRMPTRDEYDKAATEAIGRDERRFRRRIVNFSLIHGRMKEEVIETFQAHPVITAKVLALNLWDQMTTGWLWTDSQLPRNGMIHRVIRLLFSLTSTTAMQCLWYVSLFSAVPFAAFRKHRAAIAPLTLCMLAFLYIAAGTATIRWEGSRLLLAGEAMATVLVAYTATSAVGRVRDLFIGCKDAMPSRRAGSSAAVTVASEDIIDLRSIAI